MNVHRYLAALVLLLVGSFCHAATTQYYYDDLGRIVQAVRSDGAVFQYQYDANGNVLAINRISASSVSIAELTPRSGHASSSVTNSGTGFSTTPSQNTVTFNGGAHGTVTSATATRLTVTIPQTAQDGPVSVTVSSTTATSAMSFTVRRPTILSFAPAGVAPGGQVTITGTNLNLVPGQTTVSVGATSTTVVSATNTKLVFTAPTVGSGVIHVNTPYGKGRLRKGFETGWKLPTPKVVWHMIQQLGIGQLAHLLKSPILSVQQDHLVHFFEC
jgi:YD repeat-containing protein